MGFRIERFSSHRPSAIKEVQDIGGLKVKVSTTEFIPPENKKPNEAILYIPGWSIQGDSLTVKKFCQTISVDTNTTVFAAKATPKAPVNGYLGGAAEAIRRTFVDTFVRKGQTRKLTVIGHSEGGAEAIALVTRLRKMNPEINLRLILLDPVSLYAQDPSRFLARFIQDSLKTVIEIKKEEMRASAIYLTSCASAITKDFLRLGLLGFIRNTGRQIRQMAKLSQFLEELTGVPVDIIQGENDIISDPRKTFPSLNIEPRMRKIAGGRHNAPYIHPEEIVRLLNGTEKQEMEEAAA